MLSGMDFVQPQHSREIVDSAGRELAGSVPSILSGAQAVVHNWRASHAYPLNTFQMTLRHRALRVDRQAVVAQRSKRLSSILGKLRRMPQLPLSEMQDIAGCRAIIRSVPKVKLLAAGYHRRYSQHDLVSYNDYIRHPKSDGYRGYHLIFGYSNPQFPQYRNLKIEIQLRTKLQHCWATAVETVDLFYGQGLKAHQGSPEWKRFFALMGTAMAMEEGYKRVPRTPKEWTQLTAELRECSQQLEIHKKLRMFGRTLNVVEELNIRNREIKYVLLNLQPQVAGNNNRLTLHGYSASGLNSAVERYEELERGGAEAVLVSTADMNDLKRAYPNYYMDTHMFLDRLTKYMSSSFTPPAKSGRPR